MIETDMTNNLTQGFTIQAVPEPEDPDVPEVDFDYDGYQVVRGEFFSHVYEPSFSFNGNRVYVNTTCLKRMPDYDYVQILVNPEEKKLAVRPCPEDERDSFRWCSASGKRSPKQITCRMFFAKVMSLMGWDPSHRYKLLGKLIRSNSDYLFVFDLNAPEIYQRRAKEDGKLKTSRTPIYPEEWKNQFGQSYKDHQKSLQQVGMFDGYAVFTLQQEPKKKEAKNEQLSIPGAEAMSANRSEEKPDSNSQEDTSPSGGSGLYSVLD